jgi:membrane-associated phospholipid phosphatase
MNGECPAWVLPICFDLAKRLTLRENILPHEINLRSECRRETVMISRRSFLGAGAMLAAAWPAPVASAQHRPTAEAVLQQWYGLALELVRHTATYTPPVASRSFAYLGLLAFEAVASSGSSLQSYAGQLPGLKTLPVRQAGKSYDLASVLHETLSRGVRALFSNTGPAGLRAMGALQRKLESELAKGISSGRLKRSRALGAAIASQVMNWAAGDGGADIELMGFASTYTAVDKPGHWKPTSLVRLQQLPLLPNWGKNRTFAVASGATCSLPSPPAYSEDNSSEFYKQALEVYDTAKKLTPEQRLIARFWSDDPMLSPTPPGHWVFIATDLLNERKASIEDSVELLSRLGIALSDAFVACWHSKFEYDLLRPVTYIKQVIDKTWEPILITPPFPEYPSGHSSQSGAAAEVLTAFFGDNVGFADKTHVREKLPVRNYVSFRAAAEEAGISRLYGGIHFRAAVERGLEQGRCIGAAVNALKTRRIV